MKDRLHRAALRLYRSLPVALRRRVVRYLSPSFTVGAMCFVERSDGALLLVRHTYRRDGWGVPGGLLKRGEAAADAAYREVMEEVALPVELVGEPAVTVDPVPQRIDVIFRARLADDQSHVPVPSSPEIVEARWFPADGLPDLQFETSTALMNLARSSRSPQANPLVPLTGIAERRSDAV